METNAASTTAESIPQSLRDAFAANDVSQFRTILSELTDSGKAADEFRPDIPPHGLLACVADSKSPRVCDVVIDAGLNITIPGSYEPDLLEHCIDGSDPTLVKHILSPQVQARTKARLAHARYGDCHPAIVAARSPEMAQTLIDHGAKLHGTGVLRRAARDGKLPLMECFLHAGVDVNGELGAGGRCGSSKGGHRNAVALGCVRWRDGCGETTAGSGSSQDSKRCQGENSSGLLKGEGKPG